MSSGRRRRSCGRGFSIPVIDGLVLRVEKRQGGHPPWYPPPRGVVPLWTPQKGRRGILSVVINNDGDLVELRAKMLELWERLQRSND